MMNAKQLLAVLILPLSVVSCDKEKEVDCTAYSADGTAMYEVVGVDICNGQIDQMN